jgi:hypothetical protein
MNTINFKGIDGLKWLLLLNFLISVILLFAGCFLSVSDGYSLFEFNEDLYGALDNNLRMIMIYLGMTELIILIYCAIRKNFRPMIPVGFFLILMVGSMEFYGEINTVEIDPNFPIFFFYVGVSHILFGIMDGIIKNNKLMSDKLTY